MSGPYLGDFVYQQTVRRTWNSYAIAGESSVPSVAGTVSVYKDLGTTQTTTGVTAALTLDSLNGVNHVTVVTTDAFYVRGSDYDVVLSAATIDGKTIQSTLFSFSIENRYNNGKVNRIKKTYAKDATSQRTHIDIESVKGGALTGLVFNSSGLTAYYIRPGGTATAITLATLAAADSGFSSGGFKESDATNMPGDYVFHIPDAVLATGQDAATIVFKGAALMQAVVIDIDLVDPVTVSGGIVSADLVKWLGTAAATPTVAGVPEVDVTHWLGTAAATPTVAGVPEVDITHWKGTAAATVDTAGYPVVTIKDGTGAGELNTSSGTVTLTDASLSSAKFAAGAIDAAALAADAGTEIGTAVWATTTRQLTGTQTFNVTGNITGNLSGTVGSVTGAVGSVAAGGITAASFAAGAVDAAALAADAGTEIGTAVWATTTRQLTGAQTFNLTGDITGNLSGSVGSVTGAVGSVAGAVASVSGAVGSVTGNVGGNVTGSVGSLATQAKADVNAEVLDVMAVDTHAESAAVPAATASLKDKIGWMATLARNKFTQTSTTFTLRNDADSGTIATSTVSDDATTFTRGEYV